jgi:type IV pilus assembly protein PilB
MAQKRRLGEILLQRHLISEHDLDLVIAEQGVRKMRLGELIYEKCLVPKEALIGAVKVLTHCEYCDTSRIRPDAEALRLLPQAMAEKHGCIPIRINGRTIEIAFAEPQDLMAIDELSFAVGLKIIPFIEFRAEITKAIDRLYSQKPEEPEGAPSFNGSELEFLSASSRQSHKEALRELQANQRGETTKAVRLLSSIIASALNKKASDIHLEQQSDQLVVRLRVDGVLRELLRITDETRAQLISRVKILADLDIAERRVPQDGRFLSRRGTDSYDIRVSTLPTQFGEKVVMRILDPTAASVPFEALGFSPADSAALSELVRLPQGMILVTGPTGSGKSTTLYAALNLIRSAAINITTIEDPIEYVIEGANQVQVDIKAGRTFAGCLRSMLRQDPNVVMVGEIRDSETAEIALTGAQTGHLLFSTLHTNDSASSVSRLIDLQIPPFFIASSVNAILAQRLVRKLCRCRIESPDVAELQAGLLAMGYKETPLLAYLPRGCDKCDNTGYRGRIGIYELLMFDDHIRQAIRNNVRDEVLRDFATSSGMRPMMDDAVDKVLQGVTTLEEVLRVVPHTRRVNVSCAQCNSNLNPRFRFCPFCGAACQPNLIPQEGNYGIAQPLSGTL